MGILVPAKALGGNQSTGLAALSGLFEGLAQGVPIAEQMRARRVALGQGQQELDMRRGEFDRRRAKEDRANRIGGLIAQFGMMDPGAVGVGLPNREQGQAGESGSAAPPPGDVQGPPVDVGVQGPPSPESIKTYTPEMFFGMQQALGKTPGYSDLSALPRGSAQQGPMPNPEDAKSGPPVPGQARQQAPAAHSQRFAWLQDQVLHNPAFKDLSPEEAHQILEAGAHDDRLHAVNQHADRVIGALQKGIEQGAYRAVDKFGNPDTTGEVAMQSIYDQISRADRSDPQHMAALLDKAEEAEREIRMAGAQKQSIFEQRQRQDQMFQADRQARMAMPQQPGQPDVASSEMDDLYNQWQRGLIDDKTMAAKWSDAKNGTLGIKQQMQELQLRNAQLENALRTQQISKAREETQAASPEGRAYQSRLDTEKGKAIAGARQSQRGFKPAGPGEIAKARKDIAATLDQEFPMHGFKSETPEQKQAYEARRAELERQTFGGQAGKNGNVPRGTSGPPTTELEDLRSRYQSGEIDEEELMQELERLGIDPNSPEPR